jgi:hypothetical protein
MVNEGDGGYGFGRRRGFNSGTYYFPQVQLPAAHVQLPPQSQLEFPQPDIFLKCNIVWIGCW